MIEEREVIISRITTLLQDEVEFALLYGSILNNSFNDDSDIDIGIYLKKPFANYEEGLEYRIKISSEFSRDIDMVILNKSDLIIAMQILYKGKLIINNDFNKFIEFKTRIISKYCDFKFSRKIIEDRMLNGRIFV